MTDTQKRLFWRLCAFTALITASTAHAEVATPIEEPRTGVSIDVTLAVVSDYRFRGVSLSDMNPALQPELTISHSMGLYLDLWGSTIAVGDDVELDATLGFAGSAGKVDYDLSAALYTYPGASQFNYAELRGSFKTGVGPVKLSLEVAYAPRQDNIGGMDNLYVAANGELPIANTPIKLTGSIGVEDGAFADKKIDWSLGANADVAGFTVDASYVDTARTFGNPMAKAAVVVSLSRVF